MTFSGTEEEYDNGIDSLMAIMKIAIENKHSSTGIYFRDFLLNQYNSSFDFNFGSKMTTLDITNADHFVAAITFLIKIRGQEIHNLFSNGDELFNELKRLAS